MLAVVSGLKSRAAPIMRFWIRHLVSPYRGVLLLILLAMLLETAASLAEPWPLKIILDNVVGAHHLPSWLAHLLGTILGGTDRKQVAVIAVLGVVVIAAIGGLASYLDNWFTEIVAQRVAHDLRMRTYHHLQRLSLGYYDKHQIGGLISTLTTDIGTIQTFASSGVLDILVDVFTVLGMLGLMAWLRWDFALVAAAVAPFLLLFVSRFKRMLKKATQEVRKNEEQIVTIEMQGLQAQRVVAAFGTQGLEEERLRGASLATVESALKARRIKSLVLPLTALAVSACTALVLWRGAELVLAGVMTAGVLTVFLSYLTKFFKPVRDLAKMTNSVAQASVAAERTQAIMKTDSAIVERPDAREVGKIRAEIIFDRVAFGYEPGVPVLRDVSFGILPGQFVGIVGPTGSGKSTVLSLIARFYDPTQGAVSIGGTDIRAYKLQSLRQSMAMVLQDTVLFRATIGENIAYGRKSATFADIVQAARIANAHDFIQEMPYGYNTLVGERGLTLSGGQRQRIGIARAVIRNSPILILDEPTASLDIETEASVMEALERAMKNRTVIMVSHRLSALRDASNIIVLREGRVAEQGNHNQLNARGGIYSEIFNAQSERERAAQS
jgi:ABC-type multidrug transport system fused ATPase/permease subunit